MLPAGQLKIDKCAQKKTRLTNKTAQFLGIAQQRGKLACLFVIKVGLRWSEVYVLQHPGELSDLIRDLLVIICDLVLQRKHPRFHASIQYFRPLLDMVDLVPR